MTIPGRCGESFSPRSCRQPAISCGKIYRARTHRVREGLFPVGVAMDDLKTLLTLGNSEAIALAVEEGLGVGFISRIVVTHPRSGPGRDAADPGRGAHRGYLYRPAHPPPGDNRTGGFLGIRQPPGNSHYQRPYHKPADGTLNDADINNSSCNLPGKAGFPSFRCLDTHSGQVLRPAGTGAERTVSKPGWH